MCALDFNFPKPIARVTLYAATANICASLDIEFAVDNGTGVIADWHF